MSEIINFPSGSEYICPLCWHGKINPFHTDKTREYLQCDYCRLVFVPKRFHLSHEDEKKRYDLHQNEPEDQGYRKFLSRLADPLLEVLPSGRRGLDFGCGPGPVLSLMLARGGHNISLYDPYYFNDPQVLKSSYDFITATEVAEHLADPGGVFNLLFSMLKPGGYLGLMTKQVPDLEDFSLWHYIQDETHISFYSRETFEYLSERYDAELEFIGRDVILMRVK